MRHAPTVPERLLWQRLRAGQVFGLKFRRQHVIGHYIVDFYSDPARLIVEIDGPSHIGEEVLSYDRSREAFLIGLGYRVVRYSNDEVLRNMESVLMDIARHAGIEVGD